MEDIDNMLSIELVDDYTIEVVRVLIKERNEEANIVVLVDKKVERFDSSIVDSI